MTNLVERLRQIRHRPFKEADRIYVGQGADEIERLRQALKDVMNAANDPFEVAHNALTQD